MSTRNLTERSPITDDQNSDDFSPRNPFINAAYEDSSNSNSSEDSSSNLNTGNYSQNVQRRPYLDSLHEGIGENNNHTGSYQSSLSNLQRTGQNSTINNQDISSPLEYDRYPTLSGSRVNSVATSLNSRTQFDRSNNSHQKKDSLFSTTSDSSSNPFLVDTDFSPFGGYPASSFPLHIDDKEPDDYIHNPDPIADAYLDKHRFVNDFKNMDKRSAGGLIGVVVLILGGLALFVVWPAVTYTGVADTHKSTNGAKIVSSGNSSSNSTNSSTSNDLTSYQYPTLTAIRTSLIDPDTPKDAYNRTAKDGSEWQLVFSDEFNAEGRTFYDGDDQFWTAPDINYGVTKDLEWYDPDAATTSEGVLELTMDAFQNHDLFYRSGMLQSWNKFCFTQGAIEFSAQLPNYGNITGLWPGLWTLGNLGRPGYPASTDGVWPYSYEACDAGITANQSSADGISYLMGQRLNVCTCDDEEHPNQGTGRGAPEIDVLEGEVDTTLKVGLASQSIQIAPFDIWYMPDYDFIEIYNNSLTSANTYCGGPYQQAVSAVSTLNTSWYEFGETDGHYQKYGFEYLNDNDDGYCMWVAGEPTFTVYAQAFHPNGNIDWRRISKEPMSIIINLGISNSWAYIDWPSLLFPVKLRIDHVRIYQPPDAISVTCDPEDHPTYDYINDHLKAYANANLTSWADAGYDYPKNILTGNCDSSEFKLSSSN